MKYKCLNCRLIMEETPCPICRADNIPMCEDDHCCQCLEDIHSGIAYCEKCGQPVCPCGSHDSAQTSRVTGYLADVAGFNSAKRQELKDRQRYDVGSK